MSEELTDGTERECTIMDCSGTAEFAYWMPDLGQFSKARNPEHDLLEDGDLAPYVCAPCRDRLASSPHWDENRFSRPEEKLVTDGGLPPRPPEPERDWVCPGCDTAYHGKPEHVTEDPFNCFCSDECFEQSSTGNPQGGGSA